jgi:hypothetical protein
MVAVDKWRRRGEFDFIGREVMWFVACKKSSHHITPRNSFPWEFSV